MEFDHFGHDSATSKAIAKLEELGQRWDSEHPENRLRQIHREAARFLWTTTFACAPRFALEVGGGSGYSTLWIASALRKVGGHLVSVEVDADKRLLAESALASANLSTDVTLCGERLSDQFMRTHFPAGLQLCFLDCWKQDYRPSLEIALPYLTKNALIVADNAVSHESKLEEFFDYILELSKQGVARAALIPVGEGLLVVSVLKR
jgi:predicted O-methyltransferase YrrM